MQSHTSSCLLESEDETLMPRLDHRTQIHVHTHAHACTNTHTSRDALFFSTSSCLLEIWLKMTDIYTRFIACTNTHTPRCAFLFHTYRAFSFRNLRTYFTFTSVGRVSLLSNDGRISDHTVRHRAWSVHFLVIIDLLLRWYFY